LEPGHQNFSLIQGIFDEFFLSRIGIRMVRFITIDLFILHIDSYVVVTKKPTACQTISRAM
jgi:hypothetical protein